MKDYNILFDDLDAYICHKEHGWRIGLAKIQQGLYYLPWKNSIKAVRFNIAVQTSPKEKITEIHQRMGIPHFIFSRNCTHIYLKIWN